MKGQLLHRPPPLLTDLVTASGAGSVVTVRPQGPAGGIEPIQPVSALVDPAHRPATAPWAIGNARRSTSATTGR